MFDCTSCGEDASWTGGCHKSGGADTKQLTATNLNPLTTRVSMCGVTNRLLDRASGLHWVVLRPERKAFYYCVDVGQAQKLMQSLRLSPASVMICSNAENAMPRSRRGGFPFFSFFFFFFSFLPFCNFFNSLPKYARLGALHPPGREESVIKSRNLSVSSPMFVREQGKQNIML
ncbi:hypothetical protein LZ31DRAFT_356778 [Colletotrichum somersetense]|nr:hypothetical protein LZ31DRAFT_356778 [Colletotrichum somersetense]